MVPSTSRINSRIPAAVLSVFNLDYARAKQVVYVERADQPSLRICNRQGGDAMRLHQMYSLRGQSSRTNGLAVRRHHRAHGSAVHINLLVKGASEISVRKHPENLVARIHDHGHPQSLTRHL